MTRPRAGRRGAAAGAEGAAAARARPRAGRRGSAAKATGAAAATRPSSGLWRVERSRREAVLVLSPFAGPVRAALEERVAWLLAFIEPEAARRAISIGAA